MSAGQGPLGRQIAAKSGHLEDERLRRFRPGLDANAVFAEQLKRIGADHHIAEPDDVDLDRIRRGRILLQLLVAFHDPVMPISGHESHSGRAGRVLFDLRHDVVVRGEGFLVLRLGNLGQRQLQRDGDMFQDGIGGFLLLDRVERLTDGEIDSPGQFLHFIDAAQSAHAHVGGLVQQRTGRHVPGRTSPAQHDNPDHRSEPSSCREREARSPR